MSAARTRRRPFQTGWLGGLGCGALLMVNPATLLFLAVLLAPSMLMRISDDRPERAGARAVLLCNVAAVIGPFCRLWQEFPPSLGRALDQLSNVSTVAWAWLAAGSGWLVSEALIFAADRYLLLRGERSRDRIDMEIARLVEEWGAPGTTSH